MAFLSFHASKRPIEHSQLTAVTTYWRQLTTVNKLRSRNDLCFFQPKQNGTSPALSFLHVVMKNSHIKYQCCFPTLKKKKMANLFENAKTFRLSLEPARSHPFITITKNTESRRERAPSRPTTEITIAPDGWLATCFCFLYNMFWYLFWYILPVSSY